MTFDEAVNRACIIGDFDREDYTKAQYAAMADQAQKILSGLCTSIINIYKIHGGAAYEMPPDFKRLVRVKRHNTNELTPFELTGSNLYIEGDGDFDVYYEAVPSDITALTSDEYIFEIPKYAHFAIPYYIVYQLLKSTDTETSQAALTEWNKFASLLTNEEKTVEKQIKNCY